MVEKLWWKSRKFAIQILFLAYIVLAAFIAETYFIRR